MKFNDLIGRGYKIHGRTKEEGFDCWGLVLELYKREGITLPDPCYFDTEVATNKRVLEGLEATIPNIKLDTPEPGCIIEFKIFGEPSHVGIYIGNNDFIHSSQNTGVVVDKLYRWEKRITGFYRVIL
jgi:cell wall-associated NlpC family hydrolase